MSQLNVDTIKKADGTGNLSVPAETGTLVIKDGSGNIVMANGSGIDFSASEGSGATTSVLDDYEEGTWTPVAASNSTPVASFTTTAADNRYTKVGSLVTLTCTVSAINTTGTAGAGQFQLSGLPFVPKSTPSTYHGAARHSQLSLASGYTQVVAEINAGLNIARWIQQGSLQVSSVVDHSHITDDTNLLILTVTYLTDS